MAIQTFYNPYVVIAGTTHSDHAVSVRVNKPQQANEAQAGGDTHKKYRPGMGDPSIEITFRADDSTASINYALSNLVSPTSTGFTVAVRRINAARSSANKEYGGEFIISGDLQLMDDTWGEVPQITARLVPFGTFTETATTT